MKTKKNTEPEDLSPRLKQLQAELIELRSRKPVKEQAEKKDPSGKIWLFLIGFGLIISTLLLLFILFGDDALNDKPNDLYKVILFSCLLILAPALLISFINISRSGPNIRQDRKRSSRTKGLIVSNDINSGRGDSSKIYQPGLTYKYDINNTLFTDKHGLWRHWHKNPGKVKKAFRKYPIGNVVNVYYDPNDIKNSAIKRTNRFRHFIMIMIYLFSSVLISSWTYIFLRFTVF